MLFSSLTRQGSARSTMKRIGAFVLGALLSFSPKAAYARSHHGSSHSRDQVRTEHSRSYRTHDSYRTTDRSRGHTRRDPAERRAFQRQHPCPANGHRSGSCPGYVVDHVKALKHGGADRPWNMQWQTVAEAKAKDKWE